METDNICDYRYMCNECGVRFMEKDVLVVHQGTHSSQKTVCIETSNNDQNLNAEYFDYQVEKSLADDNASTEDIIDAVSCFDNSYPFACHLCSVRCKYMDVLIKHMLQTHKSETTSCVEEDINNRDQDAETSLRVCGKSFGVGAENSAECSDKSPVDASYQISCHLCGVRFKEVDILVQHLQTHSQKNSNNHNQNESRLKDFQKSFGNDNKNNQVQVTDASVEHCAGRNAEKDTDNYHYTCSVCRMCFKDVTSLSQHERTHSVPKTVKTADSFPFVRLKNNVIIELIPRFACNVCGMLFEEKADMNECRKTHSEAEWIESNQLIAPVATTDNKRHDLVGGKSFGIGASNHHRRENASDQTLYQCDICDECFSNRKDMSLHMSTHLNPKCEICLRSFFNMYSLNRHKRLKHNGRVKKNQKIHKKLHSFRGACKGMYSCIRYKCNMCEKICKSKRNLKLHKKIWHKKPKYRCQICEMGFTKFVDLETHTTVFTDEIPCQWEYCLDFLRTDSDSRGQLPVVKRETFPVCPLFMVEKLADHIKGEEMLRVKYNVLEADYS